MAKRTLPDLILAGFGGPGSLQLTLEAQQLAGRAGQVLALRLPERVSTLFRRQGVDLRSLDELVDEADPATSYARVAETVLETAAKDPPVMFVSQGSPLLLNAITRYIAIEAPKRELTLQTLPGVSSFDAAVANLGIDVGQSGLQVLAARGLVARPLAVNPNMPLLLLEAGAIEDDDFEPGEYRVLRDALRMTYPDSQPVTVLNSSASGMSRATAKLGNFAKVASRIDVAASIFIDVARGQPASPPGVSP